MFGRREPKSCAVLNETPLPPSIFKFLISESLIDLARSTRSPNLSPPVNGTDAENLFDDPRLSSHEAKESRPSTMPLAEIFRKGL